MPEEHSGDSEVSAPSIRSPALCGRVSKGLSEKAEGRTYTLQVAASVVCVLVFLGIASYGWFAIESLTAKLEEQRARIGVLEDKLGKALARIQTLELSGDQRNSRKGQRPFETNLQPRVAQPGADLNISTNSAR